jgi:uncharacterized membrane protein YeaQ/YmgE (transglycosylase-associated protein family)
MGILGALFVGLIVGAVAKLLMPGRDPGGIIVTALLGMGGAIIANFLGRSLGFYREEEVAGFIAAVIGAVLLLGLYRALRPAPQPRTR